MSHYHGSLPPRLAPRPRMSPPSATSLLRRRPPAQAPPGARRRRARRMARRRTKTEMTIASTRTRVPASPPIWRGGPGGRPAAPLPRPGRRGGRGSRLLRAAGRRRRQAVLQPRRQQARIRSPVQHHRSRASGAVRRLRVEGDPGRVLHARRRGGSDPLRAPRRDCGGRGWGHGRGAGVPGRVGEGRGPDPDQEVAAAIGRPSEPTS